MLVIHSDTIDNVYYDIKYRVNKMNGETYHSENDKFLHDFQRALITQINTYRYEDPANYSISVFADAAYDALEEDFFRNDLELIHTLRPELDAQTATRLLLRSYQADLLDRDENYPESYQEKSRWLEEFQEVAQKEDRHERLLYNMLARDIQTNVAERYKAVKILAAIYEERFETPPSLLDVGCSVRHGGLKLIYNLTGGSQIAPFESIEVVKAKSIEDFKRPEALEVDERITKLSNLILNKEINFGPVIGVDIADVTDPATRAWARACMYPDEYRNKEYITEYDLLDRLDPEQKRVKALLGDFSTMSRREFVQKSPVHEVDIAVYSAIMYQVPLSERLPLLVNGMNAIKPSGLLVLQDAVKNDNFNPLEKDAIDGAFGVPYNFRTLVYDMAHREDGWQEVFRWENGRCRRMALGLGRVSIRGEKYSVPEALEVITDKS